MKRKGIITDIWSTIIIWLVVIIAIIIIFFMLLFLGFNKEEYTVRFLDLNTKPYTLGNILSNVYVSGSPFFEQVLEGFYSHNHREDSNTIESEIEGFLNNYDFKYSIIVKDENGNVTYNIGKLPEFCGYDLEGICVRKPLAAFYVTDEFVCHEGRVPILEGSNKCPFNSVCCKEVAGPPTCDNGKGKCTTPYPGTGTAVIAAPPTVAIKFNVNKCGPGRVEISSGKSECEQKTGSSNYYCCKPITTEDMINSGELGYAEIPFLYRDKVGTMEIRVQ